MFNTANSEQALCAKCILPRSCLFDVVADILYNWQGNCNECFFFKNYFYKFKILPFKRFPQKQYFMLSKLGSQVGDRHLVASWKNLLIQKGTRFRYYKCRQGSLVCLNGSNCVTHPLKFHCSPSTPSVGPLQCFWARKDKTGPDC